MHKPRYGLNLHIHKKQNRIDKTLIGHLSCFVFLLLICSYTPDDVSFNVSGVVAKREVVNLNVKSITKM